MASGSFTGSTNNQYITPRILWSSTPNNAANTSNITVTFQLMKSSASSSSTYGTGAWTMAINGQLYDFSTSINLPANGAYVTVYSKTVNNIAHNSDGTKSFAISVSGGISGTSYTATTIGQNITLDAIARASTVSSFSFTNGYIEQGIDVTIAAKLSGSYHDIHLYIPDTSGVGINLTGTTSLRKPGGTHHINFTAGELTEIYNALSTKTSSQFTVYVRTYTGVNGTAVGDWTFGVATGNISESVKPTISSLSPAIGSNGLDGLYVQGKSTVKLTCSATMGAGATISSYRFSGPSLNVSTINNNATSGIITSDGTLTYTVTVTDSRGRQASETTQIYVYPYSKPGFKSATVNRCDANGNLSESGTYAKYEVQGSYSSVGGKNTRKITIAYSSNDGQTYSAATTIQAESNTAVSVSGIYGSGALSTTSSYKIKFTITDSYNASDTYELTLLTVSRALNIKANKKGVAFGKIAEGDGIETPWNFTFKGGGEKALIFESGSSSAWKTQFYQGNTNSTAVLGAYDVTNNRNIWAYANNGSFYINRPAYGLDGAGVNRKILLEGKTDGNARQLTNVFTEHFPNTYTGYIAIRLGTVTRTINSMITVKGHVTSYQNSTSFEASCYFYNSNSLFYGTTATMTNPDVLKEVYFAEGNSDGYVYLIIGSSDSNWSYPTVAIDTVSIGYSGHASEGWDGDWSAELFPDLSSFKTVTSCARGGMKKTLWSGGAAALNTTLSLSENIWNFKFLTCILGTTSGPYGIVLGSFMDEEVDQLHFGAIFTEAGGFANSDTFGAQMKILNQKSVQILGAGSQVTTGLYVRKIVGWR